MLNHRENGEARSKRINLQKVIVRFHNKYDRIRGSQVTSPFPLVVSLNNRVDVNTIGVEVASDIQMQDWWKIRGVYSYINTDADIPSTDGTTAIGGHTPIHQGSIRSLITFPYNVEFDSWLRIVDKLKAQTGWRVCRTGSSAWLETHLEPRSFHRREKFTGQPSPRIRVLLLNDTTDGNSTERIRENHVAVLIGPVPSHHHTKSPSAWALHAQ